MIYIIYFKFQTKIKKKNILNLYFIFFLNNKVIET